MLSKSYIEDILDYAVSCGADYAEVFFEDTWRTNLNLVDEQVSKCVCGREHGIGIRMFKGEECEYLYSTDVAEKTVLELLKKSKKRRGVFEKRAPLCRINPHKIS